MFSALLSNRLLSVKPICCTSLTWLMTDWASSHMRWPLARCPLDFFFQYLFLNLCHISLIACNFLHSESFALVCKGLMLVRLKSFLNLDDRRRSQITCFTNGIYVQSSHWLVIQPHFGGNSNIRWLELFKTKDVGESGDLRGFCGSKISCGGIPRLFCVGPCIY